MNLNSTESKELMCCRYCKPFSVHSYSSLVSGSLLADISFLCVAWADEYRKRDLNHGSTLAVLSMCGGYVATESSRDASCCVGSVNNSGITVKECARHSGFKSQSANVSWGARFEECRPRLCMVVGSKRVSTDGRGLFSHSMQKEKRPVLAGKVNGCKNFKRKTLIQHLQSKSHVYCKDYFFMGSSKSKAAISTSWSFGQTGNRSVERASARD